MKTVFMAVTLVVFGQAQELKAQVDDPFELEVGSVTSQDIKPVGQDRSEEMSSGLKSEARQNRSIYIVNQSTSGADSKAGAAATTEQIENNLIGSRADSLRKNRQRAELETELKVTEKIEESRLKDERRRGEALFGERLRDSDPPVVAPTPVYIPVAPPTPPPVNVEFRNELRQSLDEPEVRASKRKQTDSTSQYFMAMVGLSEFPRSDFTQGQGFLGIGLGAEVQEKILVEGMFQYATYRQTFPWISEIDEYSAVGAVKFQFTQGVIRPLVGGVASYSYRTYNDRFGGFQSRQQNSSVLDAGVLGGAQFALSEDFYLGLEVRYLWNLTSRQSDFASAFFPNERPQDSLGRQVIAVTGRFNF